MRRALLILKVVLTFALLGGVLAAADLPTLGRLLGDASLGYFAAAVGALVVQTFVLSARFQTIVAALGPPIAAWTAIEVSFVGVLFNQALPSAIGGDAIRAWRLRADGRPWRTAVNAVLLDRAGGVVVLAVLAAVAVTIESTEVFAPLRLALWAVAAAGVAALAFIAVADRLTLRSGRGAAAARDERPADQCAPRVGAACCAEHDRRCRQRAICSRLWRSTGSPLRLGWKSRSAPSLLPRFACCSRR